MFAFAFQYTLQEVTLYADPLKIRRELLKRTDGRCWSYINDLVIFKDELKRLREEEKTVGVEDLEGVKAKIALNLVSSSNLEGILAEATIEAFSLIPLDAEEGTGVTEREALELLKQFMEYAEGKD